MTYRIVTVPQQEGERPIYLDAYKEDDAEETGAALAMAGFHTQIWCFDQILHEFFPS